MRGSRLVRHDHEHQLEGGVLCRWQLAVDVAGQPGRAGAFLAYGGHRAGFERTGAGIRDQRCPADQQRREHLAVKYWRSYPSDLVPALKASTA